MVLCARLHVYRSFGCTVVEMVTGHPPWHEYEAAAAWYKIGSGHPPRYHLPNDTSIELKLFLMACFTLSVDDRLLPAYFNISLSDYKLTC